LQIATGSQVNFAGIRSDPDNNLPLSYLWRFGDGSSVPDSIVKDPSPVQFDIPGTFTVSFLVTDVVGSADPTSANRTIEVVPAEFFSPLMPDWALGCAHPAEYAEHEIPESPVLNRTGSGWNQSGMHHFDPYPWWTGDRDRSALLTASAAEYMLSASMLQRIRTIEIKGLSQHNVRASKSEGGELSKGIVVNPDIFTQFPGKIDA